MTSEQQWKLFRDFAQADTSIARKYGGTGLGLAISYRFIHMMHGRVFVDSRLGEGSTFTVELPATVTGERFQLSRQQAASVITAEISDESPSAKDTVLVIDDDPSVRDLMTRFLSKLGFHAISAANGEEGLRLARQTRPRIITLDVVMPGINGWDVLAELKADSELASIPVIIVTIADNEILGMDRGASNYFVKPFDRQRLAAELKKYRSQRAPQEINLELDHSRRE